jgi:hypothetical protein
MNILLIEFFWLPESPTYSHLAQISSEYHICTLDIFRSYPIVYYYTYPLRHVYTELRTAYLEQRVAKEVSIRARILSVGRSKLEKVRLITATSPDVSTDVSAHHIV